MDRAIRALRALRILLCIHIAIYGLANIVHIVIRAVWFVFLRFDSVTFAIVDTGNVVITKFHPNRTSQKNKTKSLNYMFKHNFDLFHKLFTILLLH